MVENKLSYGNPVRGNLITSRPKFMNSRLKDSGFILLSVLGYAGVSIELLVPVPLIMQPDLMGSCRTETNGFFSVFTTRENGKDITEICP